MTLRLPSSTSILMSLLLAVSGINLAFAQAQDSYLSPQQMSMSSQQLRDIYGIEPIQRIENSTIRTSGFGGFDFGGGLDFGAFDPGSFGIDFGSFDNFNLSDFNLDFSELGLDLGDLNLQDITGTINSVTSTLSSLNKMALDASGSLNSMREGLTNSLSFNLETAFGTMSTDEIRFLARNPDLFSKWAEAKVFDKLGNFTEADLDSSLQRITNGAFNSSDLKQLYSNSNEAFNAFKGLKNTLNTLKSDYKAGLTEARTLANETDKKFVDSMSGKTLGDLSGSIQGHLERMFTADAKNPQLGENGASDPLSQYNPSRVATSQVEIQNAILTSIQRRPPAVGANIDTTCNGVTGGGAGPGVAAVGAAISNALSQNALAVGNPNAIFVGPLPEYRPSDADGSVKILWRLFGDPGGLGIVSVSGGAESPNQDKMSRIFLAFNTAVAALAAIWFAFTMSSALLQGAHDGEFLGRRYHSYWLPIRSLVGGALIIPIPGAGYSLAQVITILMATTGIGIANSVAGLATGVISEAAPKAENFILPITANQFDAQVVTASYCVASLNREMMVNRGLYNDPQNPQTTTIRSEAESANVDFGLNLYPYNQGLRIGFGAMANNSVPNFKDYGYTEDQCALIDFKTPTLKTVEDSDFIVPTVSRENREIVHDVMLEFGNKQVEAFAFYVKAVNDITKSHVLYSSAPVGSQMESQGASLIQLRGEDISKGLAPALPQTPEGFFATDWAQYKIDQPAATYLLSLASRYYNDLVVRDASRASAGIACSVKDYVEHGPKTYGWIGLGFQNVHRITTMVQSTLSASSGGTSSSLSTAALAQKYSAYNPNPSPVSVGSDPASDFSSLAGVDDGTQQKLPGEDDSGIMATLEAFSDPMKAIRKFLGVTNGVSFGFSSVEQVAQTGVNILSFVDTMFKSLLGAWALYFMATLASAAFPLLPPQLTGIFGAVELLFAGAASLWATFAMPAAYFAIKLALIIPMIPILKWIGAILDWMVVVIEAMIASPWWAMAHLDGEGEGLGRNTGHGYIFMLNLLFRPAILVITFTLITSVLGVILAFANYMLGDLLNALIGNPESTMFMRFAFILGALALMTSIFENMLTTAYSILSVVPDKVFTWIGGNFGSNVSGNMAEGIAGGGSAAANAAFNAAGTAGSGAFGAASSGAGMARQAGENSAMNKINTGAGMASEGAAQLAKASELREKGKSMGGSAGAALRQQASSLESQGIKNMEGGAALMSSGMNSPFGTRNSYNQGRSAAANAASAISQAFNRNGGSGSSMTGSAQKFSSQFSNMAQGKAGASIKDMSK